MFSLYKSLFLAFFLLTAHLVSAQVPSCISPPLPPYFIPVSETENTRSGNNYAVPFDTVMFNSTLGTNAFDIVICLDGVTNTTQISLADNYVDSLVARLQTVAHYNARFKYINVYRVAKLSNEAGAAWGYDADTTIDNRYGSRFNAFTLERLLIPEKVDTFFADVMQYVPQYDIAINLVFDKKYGGSGWSLFDGRKVASFSLEEESGWHLGDEIIIHEIQHIMPYANHGYLGDEYEDTTACAIYDSIPRSPNFTNDTLNARKWQHCESIPGVGYYPNAGICTGNYRPTTSCAMAAVFQMPPFCPVCRENSTAYFDSVINPIYFQSADPAGFSGSHTYSVSIDTPLQNTFRYQWFLNDTLIASDATSATINFDLLSNSTNHQLKFMCTDSDPFIIDTTLRKPWTVSWLLQTLDTTVGIASIAEALGFSLSPNPAKDQLQIAVTGNIYEAVFELSSADGKQLINAQNITEHRFHINLEELSSGVYFAVIKKGKQKAVKRFLKY